MNEIPMCIDDLDVRLSFINEDEAGLFTAYLVKHDAEGAVNGSRKMRRRIISFIKEAILDSSVDPGVVQTAGAV